MNANKERMRRTPDPERYRMIFCPVCRGTGKLADREKEIKVCSRCGGFGWVKKEENHAWHISHGAR